MPTPPETVEVNSRWLIATTNHSHYEHVVEVVHVQDDRALIVTVHSASFGCWWVPLSSFRGGFSVFDYLGPSADFAWVVRDVRVTQDIQPPVLAVIESVVDGFVTVVSDEAGDPTHVSYEDFIEQYRPLREGEQEELEIRLREEEASEERPRLDDAILSLEVTGTESPGREPDGPETHPRLRLVGTYPSIGTTLADCPVGTLVLVQPVGELQAIWAEVGRHLESNNACLLVWRLGQARPALVACFGLSVDDPLVALGYHDGYLAARDLPVLATSPRVGHYRPLSDYGVGDRALVRVDNLDFWGTVLAKTTAEVALGWRRGEHHPPTPDNEAPSEFPHVRYFRSNYETGEVEGVLSDYDVGDRVYVLHQGTYFWATICDRTGPSYLLGWVSSATEATGDNAILTKYGDVETRGTQALEAYGQTRGLYFLHDSAVQRSERALAKKVETPTPHWTERLTGEDSV